MSRKPFVELLKDRVVIFDGAMGTELYRRHQFVNVCFEELCVSKPDLVKEIHEANKIAGADVLTTNSFGANRYKLGGHLLADKVAEISRKAARIAREVAGDELYVAGSVGPLGKTIGIGGVSHEEAVSSFADSILGLKEGGADFIIFETFGRGDELLAAISAAQIVDMPYIPSMAIAEHKLTRHGESIEDFFNLLREGAAKPMALGFNCGVGPREMLEQLAGFIPDSPYPVLTQPNAGYPRLVHDRMIYMTSPEYLSTYASHFVQLGVRAVGGCCGTGPEHVKALADGVKSVHRARAVSNVNLNKGAQFREPVPLRERSAFAAKIAGGEPVASVEITPPLGWDLSATLDSARKCKDAGIDAINIPDGPRASSRISPLVTALKIQNEVGVEAVLHITCRDRNVIGMQSDLLGCAAAGVNNALIITGDPPKLGDYPFATAVFDIDSIGLTSIANNLNRGVDIGGFPVNPPTRFCIGVGADPTHLDMEREISRFIRKAAAGADFAITQPVYEPERLLEFIEKTKSLRVPIIAGIWPLASLRNAEFLNNEVPGVNIPESIMKRMAAHTTREKQLAEGIAIAKEILAAIRPYVAGVQVSAPFGNVNIALEVLT